MPNFDETGKTKYGLQFGQDDPISTSPCLHCFHSRHGSNIRLSEGQTMATRVSSFAEGLVFSASPLRANELFMVEIERNDHGWNGHLRIGVTQTDPASRLVCPRYALPDLVAEGDSWMYTLDRTEVDDELGDTLILPACKFRKILRGAPWGNRLNFDVLKARLGVARQVSGRTCSRKDSYTDEFQARLVDSHLAGGLVTSLSETDAATVEGSRVGVFYTVESADWAFLYFVVNGECRGPFPFELQDRPLFVACDVYGRTKTVKIIPAYEIEVPSLKSLCRDAVLNVAQNVSELPLPSKVKRYLSYQCLTN